jgi:hypothetical protein
MRSIRNLPILAVAFFISTASAQDYKLPILEHVYENGLRLLHVIHRANLIAGSTSELQHSHRQTA